MVSIMPPSGLLPGGLSGFESRYNHMAINVADYCHPYKIRKTSNSSSGKTRKASSTTTTVAATVPTAIPASASAANAVTTPHPMAATAAMKKCSCPGCQQQQPRSSPPQKIDPSVGEGGPPKVRNLSNLGTSLSKPLFVDCSVEYELPMVPKIPSDGQPLLVIHPGWQQKRRITRSSSQQRLQMEQQHRMALQQQYHLYCSQCPPVQPQPQQPQQPPRPPPASTATSTSSSRKRSYDSRGSVSSTAGMMQYTGYNEPQNQQQQQQQQQRSKRARTDPSWLLQCQEQSCIQQQQHQQQQQQQHHFMMQQQQQQQHWLRHQQNWQQQQMNAAGCPLPLPAPPPPVSARMAQAHPTGFYMHHGSQYHQWHPAYFCPPSAVQLQRQQQWLHQQQHHFQQQQQQQMVNNNLPFGAFKSGPCCPQCFEGKCHTQQQQSMGNPFNPPALPSQVHPQQQPQQQPNTTSVRYRSSV